MIFSRILNILAIIALICGFCYECRLLYLGTVFVILSEYMFWCVALSRWDEIKTTNQGLKNDSRKNV
jgi:hypothetical protein